MSSLKFILSIAIMVLCIGLIGIAIWLILFGLPKAAMDGGTLVRGFPRIFPMVGKHIMMAKGIMN